MHWSVSEHVLFSFLYFFIYGHSFISFEEAVNGHIRTSSSVNPDYISWSKHGWLKSISSNSFLYLTSNYVTIVYEGEYICSGNKPVKTVPNNLAYWNIVTYRPGSFLLIILGNFMIIDILCYNNFKTFCVKHGYRVIKAELFTGLEIQKKWSSHKRLLNPLTVTVEWV